MSTMSNMHIDIMEMIESGCSRGFMIGELVMGYGISSSEAARFIDSVNSEIEEMYEEETYND